MAQFSSILFRIACLFALMTGANADITIGTDFVLAFPCNANNFWPSLIVVNSNLNEARVTIDSSIVTMTTIHVTVDARSGRQINITDLHTIIELPVCDMNVIHKLGFRVQSSVPVSLYVNQKRYGGSTAQYLVLPTNMLASEYVGGYNNRYYGIIVAIQDGTQITMGSTNMTLNRLDVYFSTANAPVSANVPFAYTLTYSSSPTSNPYQSVMALPKSYASTEFTVFAFASTESVSLQIWSFESNTYMSSNSGDNYTLPLDHPYDTGYPIGGGSIVTTKPVQIFQYSTLTYSFTQEMCISSSIQFYTFGDDSDQPTLLLIVPYASTSNILIDGVAIPLLQYRRIRYTYNYIYTQKITGPAMIHTISTRTLNDCFVAYMYNFNYNSDYPSKYPIALNLPKIG